VGRWSPRGDTLSTTKDFRPAVLPLASHRSKHNRAIRSLPSATAQTPTALVQADLLAPIGIQRMRRQPVSGGGYSRDRQCCVGCYSTSTPRVIERIATD